MKIARALLKVGYRCNNNCAFCHAAPHRGQDASTGELKEMIRAAAAMGASHLVLSGGEATIRPDLLELCQEVSGLGLGLGLVSNGRMLAYGKLLDELLGLGLDYLHLSLAGPDAASHDGLVQAASFNQTLRALHKASGRLEDLCLNVLVTRPVLDRLPDFAALLERAQPDRVKFSLLEPEGRVLEDYDGLVPELQRAREAVEQAAGAIRRRHPQVRVVADAFPLCASPRGLAQEGLREDGFRWMAEAFEPEWHPVDEANRAFAPLCDTCSLRRRCRGLYRTQLERDGGAGLRAHREPIPNSLNLEPCGESFPLELDECPLRGGRRPLLDPQRELLLQSGPGQASPYRVMGEDFSPESQRLAMGPGRLFKDRGGGAFLEDLAKQTLSLQPAGACLACPKNELCRGLWRCAEAPPFDLARRSLADKLQEMRGRMLDVGCGGMPYLENLAPALDQGHLRCLGLEPGERLPAERPGLTIVRGRLEDFEPAADTLPFDAIGLLRSVNHLPRPDISLERLFSWLRPGGRLLLADDAVFAVLRSLEDLEALGRRPDPVFEHYHALELDEARRLAQSAGFQEVDAMDCEKTGSSLWILDLIRPG